MLGPQAAGCDDPADRVLSAVATARALGRLRLARHGCVGEALGRYRLQRYSAMLSYLKHRDDWAWVASLWREILHQAAPAGMWDAQIEFLHRINDDFFPLDENYINGCWDGEEGHILQEGVPLECMGLAWEVMSFRDFSDGARPLLALSVPPLIELRGYAVGWGENHAENTQQEAMEWWLSRCPAQSGRPWPEWPADEELALELLGALPAPLDGLATLWRCIARTGSPFFAVPLFWQFEYGDFDLEYYWGLHEVELLAREYRRIRPDIERMEAYYDWFRNTPDAEAQVVAILAALDDTPQAQEARARRRPNQTLLEVFRNVEDDF